MYNLIYLIFPPLLYAFVIYLTSPYKSISLKLSAYYFMAGILSTGLLDILNIISPYDRTVFILNPFQFYFMEIAVHEEVAKLAAFLIVYAAFKKKDSHPIGIMFYMGVVGLGFALIENIGYFRSYGEQVIVIRNATSTLAHMIFGMFTGYWISLSGIRKGKYGNRSIFDIFLLKYKNLRFIVYSIIGLLCGIMYHGLWNYNLKTSGDASQSIMILMIIIGLIGCKFASDNLLNSRK
jgi:RsiW-degrading membrane proteinase PrsW (M82 family)